MIINRDEKNVKLFLEMVEKEGKNLDPYTSEAIETLIPYAGLGAVAGHICLEIEVLKMMHVDYDRNKSRRPRSTNLNTVIDIKMQADKVRMILEYTHRKFTEGYAKLVSMRKPEVIVIARGIDFFYVSYPTLTFLEAVSRMDNAGGMKPELECMALYQSIMATLFDLHEEELKLVSEESRTIYAEIFRDSVRDKVEYFEDQINDGKSSINRVWPLAREAVKKKIIEEEAGTIEDKE